MKKRAMTREKLFQIINVVLITVIMVFYFGRLFYYKNYFEDIYFNYRDTAGKPFSEVVINSFDVSLTKDGLLRNDDLLSYTYKGECWDNYVIYSGILYRIIDIDAEGNVRIVSQQPVTDFAMDDSAVFSQSSLFHWLNRTSAEHSGIFYNTLYAPFEYLIDAPFHENTVDDPSSPDYSQFSENLAVRILSLQDYTLAGGANSYLNDGSDFWLSNLNSEGRHWFVDEQGNVALSGSRVELRGVRVVLSITNSITVKGGAGTAADPYILNESSASAVHDLQIGSIVHYSSYDWKVCGSDNGNAILIMAGVLREDGLPAAMSFGVKSPYDPALAGSLANYLNTVFLTTLNAHQDYLVEKQWDYGVHDDINGSYCLADSFGRSYRCYVSIPSSSFLFMNEHKNIFLNMTAASSDLLIYIITDDDLLYADMVENGHYVCPVICMNGSVSLLSGSGTAEDPYIVEVPAEAEVN